MRTPYDQNDSPRNLLKIGSCSGSVPAIEVVPAGPAAANQTLRPRRLLQDAGLPDLQVHLIHARNRLVEDASASRNTLCEYHSKADAKGKKVMPSFALLLILFEFYRPGPAFERQTTSERP
jgi:hypothetical protein